MVIVQEWHFKLEFGIFYCRLQYTDELNEGNTITILSINKSLVVYSCEMNHFSVICLWMLYLKKKILCFVYLMINLLYCYISLKKEGFIGYSYVLLIHAKAQVGSKEQPDSTHPDSTHPDPAWESGQSLTGRKAGSLIYWCNRSVLLLICLLSSLTTSMHEWPTSSHTLFDLSFIQIFYIVPIESLPPV